MNWEDRLKATTADERVEMVLRMAQDYHSYDNTNAYEMIPAPAYEMIPASILRLIKRVVAEDGWKEIPIAECERHNFPRAWRKQ